MAALDFLFSNSPPQTLLSPATERNDLPAWYQDVQKANILRANQIAAEPYQTYQGPRLAPLNALQQQAIGTAAEGSAESQAANRGALSQVLSAGRDFDPEEFKKFLSPYTGGVVDEIARLGNRNLMENVLPNVQTNFTSAGQPFSSREGDFTSRAIRDSSADIAGKQGQFLQSAFDSAMGNYQSDLARKLQSGTALGNLATNQQNLASAGYNLLNQGGALLQGDQQKNLDLAYQDFLEQKNYPLEQLNIISNALKNNTQKLSSVSTGYAPTAMTPQTASPISQIAGYIGGR